MSSHHALTVSRLDDLISVGHAGSSQTRAFECAVDQDLLTQCVFSVLVVLFSRCASRAENALLFTPFLDISDKFIFE